MLTTPQITTAERLSITPYTQNVISAASHIFLYTQSNRSRKHRSYTGRNSVLPVIRHQSFKNIDYVPVFFTGAA
ncbi:hypothetical protein JCM10003_2722 [Bacteroides pyogenes JCM 10003]|nr:hypothetical protein JCM10003_2722 [Bacteroides pyogenes JCM 10003]